MSRSRPFRPRLELLEDRLVPAALTLHVTTTLDRIAADGKLSLREAISRANDNPGPDTIVVPAGLYQITIPPGPGPVNDTGAFDLLDSVTLTGAGAASTVVTARQLDRVFAVGRSGSPIQVTLRGLTIRGGNSGDGGGILMGDADLTLRGCVVTANTGTGRGAGISNALDQGTGDLALIRSTVSRNVANGSGGGIYLEGSAVTLRHSTVRLNTADGSGGGISAATVTLTNSTVSGNSARFGDGGGIFATTVTLTKCTVRGNTAGESGGGITAGTGNLTNCTVSGNTAGTHGGGISASSTTLINSTVSRNTSGERGGGIDAGRAVLTNSTVSGNIAGSTGGGIRSNTATLLNVTITRNSAPTGGGIFRDLAALGSFKITNSIIAQNFVTSMGTAPDLSGEFTSQGHNLIGVNTGAADVFPAGTSSVNGDRVGSAAVPLPPRLGPLANNGGRTQTHALLPGSPALNRGDNAAAAGLTTDQRRGSFQRQVGLFVDIGAFERQ